jgi:hypothetical protein
MEEVTVTLYKINKCGFFLDGNFLFGSIANTFAGMGRWLTGLGSIGETSTYSPNEDDDILRAFCVDARQLAAPGLSLIVTWNELARVEEGVQVLEVNSQIGHAQVNTVAVDAMSLPGYPAFFCVDSNRGYILNIRFEHRLNGSRQLQKFIQGFLASASEWCVWDGVDDGRLIGYGERDQEVADGANPEFSHVLMRVAGETDYLRQNSENVRKIIKRALISPQIEEHKTFLDIAFKRIGLPVNNRLRASIPFQYEFKTRINREKFDGIVAEYENRLADDSWTDVGFTLARESSKIHWLSGGIARSKIMLDVRREDGGMVSIDHLVDVLGGKIVGMIDELIR